MHSVAVYELKLSFGHINVDYIIGQSIKERQRQEEPHKKSDLSTFFMINVFQIGTVLFFFGMHWKQSNDKNIWHTEILKGNVEL